MADGVCGIGVVGQAGSDDTVPKSSDLGLVTIVNGQVSGEKPCSKRPRLSDDHGMSNGLTDFDDHSDNFAGPPDLSNVINTLRGRFDAKFKLALKDKITSYLCTIESTEQSVKRLSDEIKQLNSRMHCIENSSEQLTKLINDRIPLPNPTNGVGQQRQLSSQAPRLPPPPPLVSAPDGPVPKQAPSNPVFILNNQISSTSLPASFSGQSVISALLTTPITPVKTTQTKSNNESNTRLVSTKVVDIHDNDTIDLTNDTSSTDLIDDAFVAAHMNTAKAPRDNVLSSLSDNSLLTNKSATSNHLLDPKQQNQLNNTLQNLVPLRKTAPVSSYTPQSVNFIPDVHFLPVARLPPVPSHPNSALIPSPIQPLPQLTIAEATEGICLQWTVGPQNHLFEPASTYEIYSYASSEVTMESLKTHLPWKKVGEVVALPLPMACTLTHVQANNMYYFIIRSLDRFGRYSEWSNVVNAYVS